MGHGDTVSQTTPTLVEALKGSPIIRYAINVHIATGNLLMVHFRAECGAEFTIFISDNHIIMSCGRGDQGALGHGSAALEDAVKPRLLEELLSQDTVGVACGERHVVAITSGEGGGVFSWGYGKYGCLGNSKEDVW